MNGDGEGVVLGMQYDQLKMISFSPQIPFHVMGVHFRWQYIEKSTMVVVGRLIRQFQRREEGLIRYYLTEEEKKKLQFQPNIFLSNSYL